jgi:ABC-2 type transport system permease protein
MKQPSNSNCPAVVRLSVPEAPIISVVDVTMCFPIVGGAYFPIDMMPASMQKIALVNPITYCLDALRMMMLQGYSVVTIAKPLATLLGIVAIFLPVSLGLFAAAVRKGRREGTLMQY